MTRQTRKNYGKKSIRQRWNAKNRKKVSLTQASIIANSNAIAKINKGKTVKYFPPVDLQTFVNFQDIDSTGTFGDPAGTKAVFNLTQGLPVVLGQEGRVDRYIRLKNISLHMRWNAPASDDDATVDPLNYCNMMLVLDSEPIKPDGTLNETNIQQILDNLGSPANSDLNLMHYQLYTIGTKQRYKVLKRKRITIGPNQRSVDQATVSYFPQQAQNSSGALETRYINMNMSKHYKISYNNLNNETDQAIKLLLWTDSAIRQHPKVSFVARIAFTED